MISPDTNILARAILEDDLEQTGISQRFLEKHAEKGELYLSPYMLQELVWLLQAKGLARIEIVPVLEKLLHTQGVLVGQKTVLTLALANYAKTKLSFTDCLITADAHLSANAKTATFDKAMQRANSLCIPPA